MDESEPLVWLINPKKPDVKPGVWTSQSFLFGPIDPETRYKTRCMDKSEPFVWSDLPKDTIYVKPGAWTSQSLLFGPIDPTTLDVKPSVWTSQSLLFR